MMTLKSKKGVSEIVSYALLIVIAMGLAVGVYSWMKFYIPPAEETMKCAEDIALFVNDYSCDKDSKKINITIENRGFFSIDGFYIRAAEIEDSSQIPTKSLEVLDNQETIISGAYSIAGRLKPGYFTTANFSYSALETIAKLQLQPYVIQNNKRILCANFADIDLEGC